MVFSSFLFLFRFLPAVLLCYFLAPERWRNLVLLLFSLVFYAWGEPVYVVLMLLSILVSYAGGILIDRYKQRKKMKAAKVALIATCAVSLSFLAFFKYAGFAIALPIGISFYTFQTMSYTIDVYRGEAAVQKNPVSFGAYVTMFPQLIAGPIVQYKTIDAQLRRRKETVEQFAEGVCRFVTGLGKKVLLANNAGALWASIQSMNYSGVPVLTAWMGLAAYTFQIYFDFSAYSDMAVGLGRMFGFHFWENFDYPYISKSITEFWRRWHISLGTWFREYVYIPMGGNRGGIWRHIRNILVVWLLTGIWHGASWNFVIWGMYYAVLLLVEKVVFGRYLKKLPAAFQHIYCIFFVMLGWNLFVFDHVSQGMEYMKLLFGACGKGLLDRETIYLLYNNAALLFLCILGSTPLVRRTGRWICESLAGREVMQLAVKNLFYAGVFILSVAWLVDASFNPFLYFRF